MILLKALQYIAYLGGGVVASTPYHPERMLLVQTVVLMSVTDYKGVREALL